MKLNDSLPVDHLRDRTHLTHGDLLASRGAGLRNRVITNT
jgi:hypothetical protein